MIPLAISCFIALDFSKLNEIKRNKGEIYIIFNFSVSIVFNKSCKLSVEIVDVIARGSSDGSLV